MKSFRELISLSLVGTMLCLFPSTVQGAQFCQSTGGCAYRSSRDACLYGPAIAFGLVSIAAIIAVAVHNRSGHSH